MEKRTVESAQAPRAIGPYSQAVVYESLVFTAGQVGLDPHTGELVGDDILSQTRQVLSNLEAVLSEAGVSFSEVLKSVIYLTDMNDFTVVNEVYSERFYGSYPARSTVEVAALPLGAKVEIDMIAAISDGAKAL